MGLHKNLQAPTTCSVTFFVRCTIIRIEYSTNIRSFKNNLSLHIWNICFSPKFHNWLLDTLRASTIQIEAFN